MELATSISLRLPSRGNGGGQGIGDAIASNSLLLNKTLLQNPMELGLKAGVVPLWYPHYQRYRCEVRTRQLCGVQQLSSAEWLLVLMRDKYAQILWNPASFVIRSISKF